MFLLEAAVDPNSMAASFFGVILGPEILSCLINAADLQDKFARAGAQVAGLWSDRAGFVSADCGLGLFSVCRIRLLSKEIES